MTNKPKAIGTAAETAVVRYLQANGFPHAERRALRGELDAGDITGCPGICIEVKGGEMARSASDNDVADWMAETITEKFNANADVGFLVIQRKGVGARNAGRWWAVMAAYEFECLASGTGTWRLGGRFPIRMLLADAVQLLRAGGYGNPLEGS